MVVITFKISDRDFRDFEMKYDLDYYDSKQEICNQAKRTLITYCEMNKLETLLEKVKLKNFHIHDYSFIDLLLMEIKDDTVIWICSGCQLPS